MRRTREKTMTEKYVSTDLPWVVETDDPVLQTKIEVAPTDTLPPRLILCLTSGRKVYVPLSPEIIDNALEFDEDRNIWLLQASTMPSSH